MPANTTSRPCTKLELAYSRIDETISKLLIAVSQIERKCAPYLTPRFCAPEFSESLEAPVDEGAETNSVIEFMHSQAERLDHLKARLENLEKSVVV